MSLDVTDLRSFYASALGQVAHRAVLSRVQALWPNCKGHNLLGLGFATPFLGPYHGQALRTLAFMPAEQGVLHWPDEAPNVTALVETMALPLGDGVIDRLMVMHALEMSDDAHALMSEIWRVLAPGGRVLLMVPNRRGLWARFDRTPFGHGRPYSRRQLRTLLRETEFSPLSFEEALYVSPFESRSFLRLASVFERIGGKFALPGGGVFLVEATKQLYRPIMVRRPVRRIVPALAPALSPVAGRAMRTIGQDKI